MVRAPRVAFLAYRVSASNKLRILITSATYTIQPTTFALQRSRNVGGAVATREGARAEMASTRRGVTDIEENEPRSVKECLLKGLSCEPLFLLLLRAIHSPQSPLTLPSTCDQRFHHPKFIPLARSSSRQMSPLTKSSPQSSPQSQPSRRARHSLDSSPGDHPKLKLIPP